VDLDPAGRVQRSEHVRLRFKSRLGRLLRRTTRQAPRAIASVCSAPRKSGKQPGWI